MQYKVIERTNPQNREEQKKWYANAVKSGNITTKTLAKKIADKSALPKGDVENVVSTLLDELPTLLTEGKSVKLGRIGSFRLSISSEGVDNKDDFKTHHIKGVRVIFTPSSDLKKALEDVIFEESK
jgi:predicted histone-like DNA-binding protein